MRTPPLDPPPIPRATDSCRTRDGLSDSQSSPGELWAAAGNQGALSILLDSDAGSIGWRMGSASPPSSVTIDFFGFNGALVNSVTQALLNGYNDYSYSGFSNFRGFTI